MSKKARKALSLLLSLVLLCGLCVPSAFAAEGTYSDTQGHWAEEAIERWSEYGIVEGNNGRFNPNASLTRAQMAKVLANTLGLTETAANPFSDVSESDWFAPYVLRCYAAGVMMGDNGKANPNATITRQQAMVMLCRALGIAPVKEPDLSAFSDSDKVGAWAAPYVAAMVESGIVGGIGNGQLAPGGNLSRAALMTILDRSVVQYINAPGTYELVNKDGIILVAAGKVTLTGKTPANILVTPAADGSTLAFDKATVAGSITVQADNAKITAKNSRLPEIAMTGEGSKVEESKPASGSSGGGGGSYVPSYSNLTVAESKTVSSGTYQNVTITDAVGDGEVTLQNLVINGDLTVQGGGSYSVKLESCVVRGRVIMAKTGGETPRLYLTNTPIAQVEAQQPAIIEAADAVSTVTAVEAKADVEVKGEQTTVTSMTVPATAEAPVSVTVSAGTVETLEVKSDATVNAEGTVSTVTAEAPVTVASGSVDTITVPAGVTAPVEVTVSASASVSTVEAKGATTVSAADNAVVGTVSAEAPVTVASGVVNTITVPETAAEAVAIQVDSGAAVAEVAVSSSAGAAITNNGTVSAVSAANEEAQSNITASGSSATPAASSHIHTWNDGVETTAPTCTATGVRTLTCTVDGCGATKTESIAALGHNWDAGKVTTEPSCKTEGVKTYTCTACQTTKTETIAAIGGHVADSPWKTVKEATCTEAGARVRVCTRCSVEFLNSDAEGVIPALGHDFTGNYLNDADGHWHKCTRCDATDTKTAHTYNTTNCTMAATCTVCSYEKAAGQHTWGEWAKADDTNHKHVCSSCQAEESAAHTWDDGVVTTPPTEETEGVKTFTCSGCGATKTGSIPMVSAVSITLVQAGSDIKASWNGTPSANYGLKVVDSTGTTVSSIIVTGNTETSNLATYLPRLTSGTEQYDLALYAISDSYVWGTTALASLEDCLEVTVSGEAVAYNMEFAYDTYTSGSYTAQKNRVTWPGAQPVGIWCANAWYRGGVMRESGSGSITSPMEYTTQIEDGDVFDLRIITAYTLDGQTLRATMTPASTKTYTEAAHTHTWDSGRVTTEPTTTQTGVRTFTCTGCQETKTETIPVLTDSKNGYDISFAISGNALKATSSAPAGASSGALYTFYFYNENGGSPLYMTNYLAGTPVELWVSSGTYTRVRLYDSSEGADFPALTPLADWALEKPVTGSTNAFAFPHTSVTVLALPASNPTQSKTHTYTFQGLDFTQYTYEINNPTENRTQFVNSASVDAGNYWVGDGMLLYAKRVSEPDGGYLVEKSESFTVNVAANAVILSQSGYDLALSGKSEGEFALIAADGTTVLSQGGTSVAGLASMVEEAKLPVSNAYLAIVNNGTELASLQSQPVSIAVDSNVSAGVAIDSGSGAASLAAGAPAGLYLYQWQDSSIVNIRSLNAGGSIATLRDGQAIRIRPITVAQTSTAITVTLGAWSGYQTYTKPTLQNQLQAETTLQQDYGNDPGVQVSTGTYVLDLNNHTVQFEQGGQFAVSGGASLTIRNGTILGSTDIFQVSGGSLTLENCTVTLDSSSSGAQQMGSVSDGTLTVESGTYQCSSYGPKLFAVSGGTLDVQGGTFTLVPSSMADPASGGAITVSESGHVTISGGSIDGGSMPALYVQGGTAEMTGGEMTFAPKSMDGATIVQSGGTLTISGGTVDSGTYYDSTMAGSGTKNALYILGSGCVTTITGGKFASDVTSYVPSSTHQCSNDGSYFVVTAKTT